MNVFLLLTSLIIGNSYRSEDLHYYNEALQAQGLPLVNKVFVDGNKLKDKQEFFKLVDEIKTVERFKEFKNNELNGILLFFNNKKDTLNALNKLAEKYPAYPVVIYNGIECTTTGEILMTVPPSVNKNDFTKRLNAVADGKFKVEELPNRPKTYSVVVEELRNPSNVLILANLIAKDRFWAIWATVYWIPLDGYVKANAAVETPSISHLGELRSLKLTVDIMDPNIKLRTDLLPQLGQGLQPFPFAGEVWFDPQPPIITETKTLRGKTVTINYSFRQLQFGNFAFQPLVVSYEKDGELLTTKTSVCQYAIRSVIAGTDIDDIQPRGSDGLDLLVLRPVGFPKTEDPMKGVYHHAKIGISTVCFGFAFLLLCGAASSFGKSVGRWLEKDTGHTSLWGELKQCNKWAAPNKQYYLSIANSLNNLMTKAYGVSLYSIDRSKCTENFRNLVNELDKIYQPNAFYNSESLKDFVQEFCKDQRYK